MSNSQQYPEDLRLIKKSGKYCRYSRFMLGQYLVMKKLMSLLQIRVKQGELDQFTPGLVRVPKLDTPGTCLAVVFVFF